MGFYCFKCSKEVSLSHTNKVGRTESCPHCRSDMHVCRNCRHYDTAAYNQCRESAAERVVEKDRSNFCDYFSMREGRPSSSGDDEQKKALKKLDDIFKK